MKLYLINPSNPLVSIIKVKDSRWNRYRVWKPLSLMVIAGMTPPEWDVSIIDENLRVPNYDAMPRPDLVGITAFTSQANRAYELAAYFRRIGIPVVMGGIHATMCLDEVSARVDAVVTGEAEGVWHDVLEDAKHKRLKPRYDGGHADINNVPLARHDLLAEGYAFGSIQTTRGCPLSCDFCSVTTFNGSKYRLRSIPDVVREFQLIREKHVLVVDDNIIGTRPEHIARAKDLFRAMAKAKVRKKWFSQTTINFADDEELLTLAVKAGCAGVFIGFESPGTAGLNEVKKFNLLKNRDMRDSVRRIQRHRIYVAGSFIIGLDVDKPGIGKCISETATKYGIDSINVLFLTPLPGTKLWDKMKAEGRIALDKFPEDWKYYTLTFPVAKYKNLSDDGIINEMISCERGFYSMPGIVSRVWRNFWQNRKPFLTLMGNMSYRSNIAFACKAYPKFKQYREQRLEEMGTKKNVTVHGV